VVWVVAAVAPLLGTLFVTADLEGTRYLYLPLVGWAMLLSELAAHQASKRARQLGLAAIVIIAAAGTYGTWRHQTAWVQAAALRDRVLAEAGSAMSRTACTSAAFFELPDNVDGAFVFRNGFIEAARTMGVGAVEATVKPETDRCWFEWTSSGFRNGH
jgi:hypothetical protein